MWKNNFDVATDRTADAEFTTIKNRHIITLNFLKASAVTVKLLLQTQHPIFI